MTEPGSLGDLREGDEFAGYRIERRLGRGGMGILFLAVEPGLERRVALKLIAPEAAADEIFAKRFAEESRIAASIEHPNVVPIYAAGEEEGIPFIAMRYVAGSDLGRRIQSEGRLEPERAAALIAQVGNGLDAIHAAGLVHRDVKPANVLVSGSAGEEHAYITDFGVARNVATRSGLTQTGRFVGTIDYVAPEQISGGTVDARADVYALGCLLFKLLTGQVPFPREGEAACLYAHLNDPPPPPSLYAPGVPIELDDVVARAMSKQPGDRYPSAGDLGRAAVAAVSGRAVGTPERTVATGAAATVETETVAPAAATAESAADRTAGPGPAAAASRDPTAEARPGPTAETRPESGGRGSSPALALLAGGLAIAAAVVLAIVLTSGGGGGSATGAGATTASGSEAGAAKAAGKGQAKPKAEPAPLSRGELIARADRSCEEAKAAYVAALEKAGRETAEVVPDVAFAETLAGISSRQVEQLEALVPPKAEAQAFDEYLASRRRVARWDRDAVAAAKTGDEASYQAAYAKRNESEPERELLADEIGFRVCSQPSR
ncbi:MAG: serine/threonine-protein kinase [Syntrophothermus sp.]